MMTQDDRVELGVQRSPVQETGSIPSLVLELCHQTLDVDHGGHSQLPEQDNNLNSDIGVWHSRAVVQIQAIKKPIVQTSENREAGSI